MKNRSEHGIEASYPSTIAQFRLRDLMLLVFFAALLVAWWVDRSNLKKQIPSEPITEVKSYSINNASTELIVQTLNSMYEEQISAPFRKNKIIVECTPSQHIQILTILHHLDRDGTDIIVAKSETETNPTLE